MGFGDLRSVAGQRQNITQAAMQEVAKDSAQELRAEQRTAQQSAQASNTQTAFRAKVKKKSKALKTKAGRIAKMMKEKVGRMLPPDEIKKQAKKRQDNNPELKEESLTELRKQIKPGDTKEEILKTVGRFYSDPSLADEALEFLMETTKEGSPLNLEVQDAREDFLDTNEREITAGRNIAQDAREASEKGLGSPTSLRDMYRDITGNPRDSTTMFGELSGKYAFKELKKVVDFLLHSLGSDMKAKGPSIPRGELHRLMTETRSMQAILGVFRFFEGRMGLVEGLFSKYGLQMPKQLNFENMAKAMMDLAGERYPSQDRILSQSARLGVDKSIPAKIIAFSQFRDAIRELAMSQVFRSLQHRDELYLIIIESLEDLEEEFEIEQENQEMEEVYEVEDEIEGKE